MPYNREGIIDNMVATVDALVSGAAIAGTALTSTTTIARVERALLTADEVGDAEFAACCVVPAESQPVPVYNPFNDIEENLDVWVIAHAIAEDAATRTQRASELERDLRCALAADPMRGLYAIETVKAEGALSDEGWPDLRGTKGGTVTVALKFRCTYYPNDGGA